MKKQRRANLSFYSGVITVKCPECSDIMMVDYNHIRCTTVGCRLRGVKFKLPTVELEIIK